MQGVPASLYRRYRLWRAGMTEADARYVASKEWLSTYEWTGIRWDAIEYYGARCMACGRTPQQDRIRLNIDHYLSRLTHPWLATSKNNLVPLCSDCNKGKLNKRSTDWRKPQGYWRHLWLAIKG